MQQWLKTILAGAVGGAIALAGVFFFYQHSPSNAATVELPVRQVNFAPGATASSQVSVNPTFDFKAAAKKLHLQWFIFPLLVAPRNLLIVRCDFSLMKVALLEGHLRRRALVLFIPPMVISLPITTWWRRLRI